MIYDELIEELALALLQRQGTRSDLFSMQS